MVCIQKAKCFVDQTWTEHKVYSWSSQLSTPPTYGLRSRQPLRKPYPLSIMPASGGTASPRPLDQCGASARALPSGR
jgi:hypothetical protein